VSEEPAAGTGDRRRDPGYHLIGTGRRAFEAAIGFRASRWGYLWHLRIRTAGDYIAAILTIAGVVILLPVWELKRVGFEPTVAHPDRAVGLLALDRCSRGARESLGDQRAGRDGPPRPRAPRRHSAASTHPDRGGRRFSRRPRRSKNTFARLEIHYLASPDAELHFALLSDWIDAPDEHTAQDAALLDVAIEGIAR